MHLDGSHTLNAPAEAVWEMIMDPEVLAKVTPGVKTLEALGGDKYKATSHIMMGAVNGLFDGEMEVLDKVAPQSFTLKMTMNGKIGTVIAQGQLQFKPLNALQTEVIFSGDAQLSGTLARTGQRVMGGVAKTMTRQFFKSLEKQIASLQEGDGPEKGKFFKKLFGKQPE